MVKVDEYFTIQRESELKYGKRTIVLYQVGSFYEMWEYDPTSCCSLEARLDENGKSQDEPIGHCIDMSVILNFTLTYEKPGEPYAYTNPHKIGFPMIAYEKNKNVILLNDYTIVRVDQEKGTGPTITRSITEVCSPSMQLDNNIKPSNNVVALYIEYQNAGGNKLNYDKYLVTCGAASVDIGTGANKIAEFHSKIDDQVYAIQELYRFLTTHQPREIVIHLGDFPPPLDCYSKDEANPYISYLHKTLDLAKYNRVSINVNKVPLEYKKSVYQTEFFNRIFKQTFVDTIQNDKVIQTRNPNIIMDLGIDRLNYGRISYMILLQHCYSHNQTIISRLSQPDTDWLRHNTHLILAHNAIEQLDIQNHKTKGFNSLYAVMDQNKTNLGKRLLLHMLQNPMYNRCDIEEYYNMVDEMSINVDGEPLYCVIDRMLKELPDLGRLQRKLVIGIITPKELCSLFRAYIRVINIVIIIAGLNCPTIQNNMFAQDMVDEFNSYMSKYGAVFDFTALECCSIDNDSGNKSLLFDRCPYNTGVYPELDTQITILYNAEMELARIVEHLNWHLTKSDKSKESKVVIHNCTKKTKKKEADGTLLLTTLAKSKLLEKANIDTSLCGEITISPYNTAKRIVTSPVITRLQSCIDNIKANMTKQLMEIYTSIIEEMGKLNFYEAVASFIAKLDLVHSYAKISEMYKYHRPTIVDGPNSFLDAKDIRHPIIERIVDGPFIPNDIALGNGVDALGMLLYGVNQTGKSSLAKAIGLNIIMAQAGCFVPSALTYRPYARLITRLSGADDMLNGQSSFAIEMTELRTILRQADDETLVIGDELAAGTESDSATGITVATIKSLIAKKSTFIFATHMHHLTSIPYIQGLKELAIAHLSVTYDEAADVLIYQRKLLAGAGSAIYGLMVAQSLGLPAEFIKDANEILKFMAKVNTDVVTPITSRYNSSVYVDTCAKCGVSRAAGELHTHHIMEQQYADDKGYIGSMHKNAKDNLIVLCKQCHNNLHQNHQELTTVKTAGGKIVVIQQ